MTLTLATDSATLTRVGMAFGTEAHDATLARIGTTFATVTNSIESVLLEASPATIRDGVDWYPSAADVCQDIARRHGLPLEAVGGIVAALSPRTPWARNLEGAESCARGSLTGGFLSRSVNAANAIREGAPVTDILHGPKTLAFARNIIGDMGPVTVDVWAWRVAMGDDANVSLLGRKGVYDALSAAYWIVGNRYGMNGCEVQAATWCQRRGNAH